MNSINEKIMKKIYSLKVTGFFHIFGSSVLNKIIAFMSSAILVRVLTKDEYGTFTYAWNIFSFILLLNGFGINFGVLQTCSENSEDSNLNYQILKWGKKYGIIIDIILAFIILLIALLIPLPIKNSNYILGLLSIMPILILLFEMQSSYLRANKYTIEFSKISMLNTFYVFVFSIIGAYLFEETGLVFGRYLAYFITIIYGVKLINKDIDSNVEFDVDCKIKKEMQKISFISMINSGLSQVLYLLDVFIIGLVVPDQSIIASYKVGTMIPSALSFIPMSLVTYIYPYFAHHHNDRKWCLKKYKSITCWFGLFNLIFSIVLLIFAPMIIRVLFGIQYSDAIIPFRILTISYFFSGTFRVIAGNILVTQKQLKFNMFVAVFSGIINVLADYYFIKMWGSNGAALATLIVVLLTSILNVLYLVNILKRKGDR
ncbi:oligosaccharide flippase family protein [Paraclostridium sordellii]|uniref:oligosaccharide flippase family protein n=3 Tax=Paraclostridium sordellii TaxID=1505 RepID=UPI0005E786FE|nr:oligosaccharide flippase family protein [Paeniclostridium sordellii]MDU2687208.1 oligosaccharide flippase family protein [Paeniclostridium sordellii]MDU6483769.1 oligosaccharide flippase family protein [Paeniclostridium sordellii]CEO30658.1 Polysaccharide biosynthesis protein [[Clostridium] sordellii] [Paeniclostridium sordellii]